MERTQNALDTDPAMRKRMSALIAQAQPEIERLMRLAVRDGSRITEIAGLISDGQGPVPKMAQVVPLGLVQPLVKPLGDCWPELAEQFLNPRPDVLPVLVFFEGQPGFAQIGVLAVRDVGAKA